MLRLLAQPLPFFYSRQRITKLSLLVAVVVSLFLLLFRPVGFGNDERFHILFASATFGSIAGIMFGVTFLIVSCIQLFNRNWTLLKELLLFVLLITVVACCNTVVRHFWVLSEEQSRLLVLLQELKHTTLIGIIPVSLIWGMNFWKRLPASIRSEVKQYIGIPKTTDTVPETVEPLMVSLSSQTSETLSIALNDLLYIKADGNYVEVFYMQHDNVEKHLLRSSLKQIEEQLDGYQQLIRTHRAYLVNTKHVSEVNGNAAGYKLNLNGLTDVDIPVSRKRIALFDEALALTQH